MVAETAKTPMLIGHSANFHKPIEAAKMLQGLKSEKLHELLLQDGVNLAKTPTLQRRGILIYGQPYQKRLGDNEIRRWRTEENWNLPLFSSAEGNDLIERNIDWTKRN